MNAFRYLAESFADLCVILWRFPRPVDWLIWGALTVLACWVTWLVTRWIYGQTYNLILRHELLEERRRHAQIEAAHEAKLAVYRDAAIKQRVAELFRQAASAVEASPPRKFVIHGTRTGRSEPK